MAYDLRNTQGQPVVTLNDEEKRSDVIDLVLQGKGAIYWGEGINANFIRLLENFACDEKPSGPTAPQTSADIDLDGAFGINYPVPGQQWFNTTTDEMYFYDGSEWKQFITSAELITTLTTDYYTKTDSDNRYVNISGDTMTGYLTLHADPTNNLHAATKQYVDAGIDGLETTVSNDYYTKTDSDNRYVNISGDTMTGYLTLHADPTNNLHAATKQYVDTKDALKVNLSGDTMTGYLTLHADPSANLHAATKQYVDSVVASAVSGGLSITHQVLNSPGYVRFSNGLTIEWGISCCTSGHNTSFVVTLPRTLAGAYSLTTNIYNNNRPGGGDEDAIGGIFLSGAQIKLWSWQDGGHNVSWIVIGYS